jgi:PKD repeat protein
VNWEWLFPGGSPETSTEENPSVVYDEPGVYPVTLKISNHLGSDTQQREIFVSGKFPLVNFSSSSKGFTAHPHSGQFLPYSGGVVELTDRSLYNPTGWEWILDGVAPGVREGAVTTVNYPPGENAYKVNLRVSNDVGSREKAIDGYVKVGGTSKIWNIPYGDGGNTVHLLSEGAYLTGTNGEYAAVAEKFTLQGNGSVSQVDLMIRLMKEGSDTKRLYTVSIHDEKEGKPGTVLA